MADQAITALPKKTYSGSSQIASTDYLLGIDSAEGYQMLIQDLGEYIINRATASLAGSTQTLASAISALNSNMTTLSYNGTVSNLQTSLQTLVSSLLIGEYRRIKYIPTETSGQFVNGHLYEGFFSRTGSNYWSLTLEDPEGQPVYGTYRNGIWAWDKLAEQTQIDTLNSNLSSLYSNLSSLYCREYSYATGTSYKAAVTDVLSKLGNAIARYWVIIQIGSSRHSLMIIKDGVQWSNGILTTYESTTTDVYFVMSRYVQPGETVVYLRKLLTGDLEE